MQRPSDLTVGDDVSPQVGRCGVPVQEHDRVTATDVHVGHSLAEHFGVLLRIALECGDVGVAVETGDEHGVCTGRVF